MKKLIVLFAFIPIIGFAQHDSCCINPCCPVLVQIDSLDGVGPEWFPIIQHMHYLEVDRTITMTVNIDFDILQVTKFLRFKLPNSLVGLQNSTGFIRYEIGGQSGIMLIIIQLNDVIMQMPDLSFMPVSGNNSINGSIFFVR